MTKHDDHLTDTPEAQKGPLHQDILREDKLRRVGGGVTMRQEGRGKMGKEIDGSFI